MVLAEESNYQKCVLYVNCMLYQIENVRKFKCMMQTTE